MRALITALVLALAHCTVVCAAPMPGGSVALADNTATTDGTASTPAVTLVEPRFNLIGDCHSHSFGRPEECFCYRQVRDLPLIADRTVRCGYEQKTGRCLRMDVNVDGRRRTAVPMVTDSIAPLLTLNSAADAAACTDVWSRIMFQREPNDRSVSALFRRVELSMNEWEVVGAGARNATAVSELEARVGATIESEAASAALSTTSSNNNSTDASATSAALSDLPDLPEYGERVLQTTLAPHLIRSQGRMQRMVIAQGAARTIANMVPQARSELLIQTFVWDDEDDSVRAVSEALLELQRQLAMEGSLVPREERLPVLIVSSKVRDASAAIEIFRNGFVDIPADRFEEFGLPASEKMPDLEVRFRMVHNSVRGTLHTKTVIVDRRVAMVTSGNVQDRPFIEMMAFMDGRDVVEGLRADFMFTFTRIAISPVATGMQLLGQLDTIDNQCGIKICTEFKETNNTSSNATVTSLPTAPLDMTELLAMPLPRYDPLFIDIHQLPLPYLPPFDNVDLDTTRIGARSSYPMLLLARPPHGAAFNRREDNPPMRAIRSLLQNARRYIMIYHTNLNTEVLLDEIVEAVARNVTVAITVTNGMNDKAELFAGGTNLQEYHRLWAMAKKRMSRGRKGEISDEELGAKLRMCWYIKNGREEPHALEIAHLKYMSVDEQVTLFGSTNFDDQSIYSSQEVNVLIDDPYLTLALDDAMRKSQRFEHTCFPAFQKYIGGWSGA